MVLEFDLLGLPDTLFAFVYRLGSLWYEQWGMENRKIGWFFPLFSSALCLLLAGVKSRNRLFWGLIGFAFPFISALVLLLFPAKLESHSKLQKPSKERREEAAQFLKSIKNASGNFEVSVQVFAASQNIILGDYINSFLPTKASAVKASASSSPSPSSSANGAASAAGDSVNVLSQPLPLTESKQLAQLQEVMASATFSIKDDGVSLAEDITELFIHQVIGSRQYIKAIASLAFDGGKNTVNLAQIDSNGSSNYQNDILYFATELATQFFSSYCASKHEVGALYALHRSKLP